MSNTDDDLTMLHPGVVPRVNANPLQLPGRDRVVRTVTTAGPDEPGDRSLYLDSRTLAMLLDIARSSATGRVRVPRCGVRVDLYEQPDGHRYEVWRFIGGAPEPEPMPAVAEALMRGGVVEG